MSSYFFVVSDEDVKIWDSTFIISGGGAGKQQDRKEKEFALQYVGYAALDMIQQSIIGSDLLYIKNVDSFEEYAVSCLVTASRVKFVLVHEIAHSDDQLKALFSECQEHFVKAFMNPFFEFPNISETLKMQLQESYAKICL